VRSDILDAEVWVVADDLPLVEWPMGTPVYTQAEVKILTEVGPDTLAWVHPVKEMFGARVVEGYRHRPLSPYSPRLPRK
jgi:hypothetical protein